MHAFGAVIVIAGLLLVLLGYVCFVVAAFRTSVIWGLAVMFLPLVWFFFLVAEWGRAKSSFFLQLWGAAIALAGLVIT